MRPKEPEGSFIEEFKKDTLKLLYVEVFPSHEWNPKEIESYWVLSTGRCATATVDRLLGLSPDVASFHEPMPRLHRYHASALHGDITDYKFFENLIYDCRIDLMSAMKQMGYKYAECQHRWTPYAPYIKSVFPNTKFIYLRRNMDHFVSSALQWNWYDLEKEMYAPSECLDDKGKLLAWFWCETNEMIQSFLETLPNSDWMFLDFNNIRRHDWNKIGEMYQWMDAEVPRADKIEYVLNQVINKGRGEKIKKGWGEFDERARKIYNFKTGGFEDYQGNSP